MILGCYKGFNFIQNCFCNSNSHNLQTLKSFLIIYQVCFNNIFLLKIKLLNQTSLPFSSHTKVYRAADLLKPTC